MPCFYCQRISAEQKCDIYHNYSVIQENRYLVCVNIVHTSADS